MDSEHEYIQAVKKVLHEESSSPSEELIRFLANRVCSSLPTREVIDRFTPIVKEAFTQFINAPINDRGKGILENYFLTLDRHLISDEDFERFFVVNVT